MTDTDFFKANQLNFLVVDDDAFMRDLVSMTLERLTPASVTCVASGMDAVVAVKNDPATFHIIMLDLLMPDMDGIETLRHLAEIKYQGGLILFSGADSSVLRAAVNVARGRYLNVLGSLSKPVKAEAVSDLIRDFNHFLTRQPDQRPLQMLTESAFAEGLKGDHLQLYYQPQVSIHTGEVLGAGAGGVYAVGRLASLCQNLCGHNIGSRFQGYRRLG